MTDKQLTDFQAGVLRAIAHFRKTHGYAPSMRDIATGMGYGYPESMVSSISSAIERLAEAGHLTRIKGIARSYVVTEKEE